MADPTPASVPTPNYNFNLPTVGGDDNVWGGLLNDNWSSIDTILWNVSGVASAALTQTAGDARYLRLTGGTITGSLVAPVLVAPNISGTTGGAPPSLINGPSPGDNSQTVPTTSWVNQAVSAAIGAIPSPPSPPSPSNAAPAMDGTAAPGSSALYARGDHVHPSDTSRLALSGGTLTGPLVLAADPAAALGAATKQMVDLKAPLASPTFTGTVTIPAGAAISGYATTAAVAAGYLPLGGGTLTGGLTVGGNLVVSGANYVQATYLRQNSQNFSFAYTSPSVFFGVNGATVGTLVKSLSIGGGFSSVIDTMALSVSGSQIGAWSGATGATWNVAVSSDRRLKANLEPPDKDALAIINALKVWQCDMTQPLEGAQPQHWDWALIADEVEPLIPLAVVPAQDDLNIYATMREYPLVVALVRAVQQLTARVEELEASRG
jgi:hypothetical protein